MTAVVESVAITFEHLNTDPPNVPFLQFPSPGIPRIAQWLRKRRERDLEALDSSHGNSHFASASSWASSWASASPSSASPSSPYPSSPVPQYCYY